MRSTPFSMLTALTLSLALLACEDEVKPAQAPAPAPVAASTTAPTPAPTTAPTTAPTPKPTAEEAAALGNLLIEQAGGDEVMKELQGKLDGAPRATDEEKAAMPKSAAAGEPSVANICNQIPLMGHCYETATTKVGKGFFSKKEQCKAPHYFFESEPCPANGRLGSCVLTGGQQVAHFYQDTDNEGMCQNFGGTWKAAAPLVWPVNGP